LFFCLFVEELDDIVAVMLGDDIQHLLRQPSLPALLKAELHMAFDDCGGQAGLDVIVLVFSTLVFNEILGMVGFADIVIHTTDPGKHGVGTNSLCSLVSEFGNIPRMVVSALCNSAQTIEYRAVRKGEFTESICGGNIEYSFTQGYQGFNHHQAYGDIQNHAADEGKHRLQG